jgi:hypothetical protein
MKINWPTDCLYCGSLLKGNSKGIYDVGTELFIFGHTHRVCTE